ncbi:DNA polymerase zeta catalytic subunit [Diplonema papillatum]|nr:DNA polymerase zeta catalytic subunit [Diplonema papillatum]
MKDEGRPHASSELAVSVFQVDHELQAPETSLGDHAECVFKEPASGSNVALDAREHALARRPLPKVPVLRIFGRTADGNTALVRVHGLFPYFFVPWPAEWGCHLAPDVRCKQLMRFALAIEDHPASGSPPVISCVSLVQGVPMYGYHPTPRLFMKIYVVNPRSVSNIGALLGGTKSILGLRYQPYNAHFPFSMQAMIDLGLTGMGTVHVAGWQDSVPKFAETEIAVDVPASGVVNENCLYRDRLGSSASQPGIRQEDLQDTDALLASTLTEVWNGLSAYRREVLEETNLTQRQDMTTPTRCDLPADGPVERIFRNALSQLRRRESSLPPPPSDRNMPATPATPQRQAAQHLPWCYAPLRELIAAEAPADLDELRGMVQNEEAAANLTTDAYGPEFQSTLDALAKLRGHEEDSLSRVALTDDILGDLRGEEDSVESDDRDEAPEDDEEEEGGDELLRSVLQLSGGARGRGNEAVPAFSALSQKSGSSVSADLLGGTTLDLDGGADTRSPPGSGDGGDLLGTIWTQRTPKRRKHVVLTRADDGAPGDDDEEEEGGDELLRSVQLSGGALVRGNEAVPALSALSQKSGSSVSADHLGGTTLNLDGGAAPGASFADTPAGGDPMGTVWTQRAPKPRKHVVLTRADDEARLDGGEGGAGGSPGGPSLRLVRKPATNKAGPAGPLFPESSAPLARASPARSGNLRPHAFLGSERHAGSPTARRTPSNQLVLSKSSSGKPVDPSPAKRAARCQREAPGEGEEEPEVILLSGLTEVNETPTPRAPSSEAAERSPAAPPSPATPTDGVDETPAPSSPPAKRPAFRSPPTGEAARAAPERPPRRQLEAAAGAAASPAKKPRTTPASGGSSSKTGPAAPLFPGSSKTPDSRSPRKAGGPEPGPTPPQVVSKGTDPDEILFPDAGGEGLSLDSLSSARTVVPRETPDVTRELFGTPSGSQATPKTSQLSGDAPPEELDSFLGQNLREPCQAYGNMPDRSLGRQPREPCEALQGTPDRLLGQQPREPCEALQGTPDRLLAQQPREPCEAYGNMPGRSLDRQPDRLLGQLPREPLEAHQVTPDRLLGQQLREPCEAYGNMPDRSLGRQPREPPEAHRSTPDRPLAGRTPRPASAGGSGTQPQGTVIRGAAAIRQRTPDTAGGDRRAAVDSAPPDTPAASVRFTLPPPDPGTPPAPSTGTSTRQTAREPLRTLCPSDKTVHIAANPPPTLHDLMSAGPLLEQPILCGGPKVQHGVLGDPSLKPYRQPKKTARRLVYEAAMPPPLTEDLLATLPTRPEDDLGSKAKAKADARHESSQASRTDGTAWSSDRMHGYEKSLRPRLPRAAGRDVGLSFLTQASAVVSAKPPKPGMARDSRIASKRSLPFLIVAALEVLPSCSRSEYPDPALDPVLMCCVTEHNINNLTDEAEDKHHIIINCRGAGMDPQNASQEVSVVPATTTQVHYMDDEEGLIIKTVRLLREIDPDILLGWDLQRYSYGYLNRRAMSCKCNVVDLLSRVPGEPKSSVTELFAAALQGNIPRVNSDDETFRTVLTITGRATLNVWRTMRAEMKLSSFTLQAVAKAALGVTVPLFSKKKLSLWASSDAKRSFAAQQLLNLTVLPLRVCNHLDMINRTVELARLYGVLFTEVMTRGSQFRVENMYCRLAVPLNYVMVTPSKKQVEQQNHQEGVPLVMEPSSGFYNDPVIVLDFRSLYPSIVIAYNLCYSTCLGKVSKSRTKKLGPISNYRIPKEFLAGYSSNDVIIAPNSCAFVKPGVRRGLFSRLLAEILSTRIAVQATLKKARARKDVVMEAILNARQTGLKMIANVSYGYTAATFTGRMPCSDVADAIVLLARQTLERVIKDVNKNAQWRARVVYGDTDSLFVSMPGATLARAFEVAKEIVEHVTASNPSPVKLKLEKVYLPSMMVTKKRYVGYAYESPTDKPRFDAKGIECIRRDQCKATQQIQETALRLLFETQDMEAVREYVQRQLSKIQVGDVNAHDLILRQEVKLGTYANPAQLPPSATVAREMMKRERLAEPLYNERVPYLVINSVAPRLSDMLVHPYELLLDKHPSKSLNATYYMTKQICPPLDRTLGLAGAKVVDWLQSLPRARLRGVASAAVRDYELARGEDDAQEIIKCAARSRIGKPGAVDSTLHSYYASTLCVVCKEGAAEQPSGMCSRCKADPAGSQYALYVREHHGRAEVRQVRSICSSCIQTDDVEIIESCQSLDCPVPWRRHRAALNLQSAVVTAEKCFSW